MNRYESLIEKLFFRNYSKEKKQIEFDRSDIPLVAEELKIVIPKNFGDLIYSFKSRSELPDSIKKTAPEGKEWIIKNIGRSRYAFCLTTESKIYPDTQLIEMKLPDATPGVVTMYSISDEQALLARMRYNRILDIFTGITCYSLQNHLRTALADTGQIEIDELYVGINTNGTHFILPVEAKGLNDTLNITQIEQNIKFCSLRYPNLICIPIGSQFLDSETICIYEFKQKGGEIFKLREKHYQLVGSDKMSEEDILFLQSLSLKE